MNGLLHNLPQNIKKSFSGRNIFLHIAAILLTFAIVYSGFDWWYFSSIHESSISAYLWPAIVLGGIVPIFSPIVLLLWGIIKKQTILINTGFALAQSAFLGLVISSTYKAFTGRIPPMHHMTAIAVDLSNGFQFGFMRGGVFWGWPSSHTTVAFATMFALITLYPKRVFLKVIACSYALYVGFGVTMGIHWFSEFIAGMLIGIAIGSVVGAAFKKRFQDMTSV
jgi:membrane-associated phospholipid phosphatase